MWKASLEAPFYRWQNWGSRLFYGWDNDSSTRDRGALRGPGVGNPLALSIFCRMTLGRSLPPPDYVSWGSNVITEQKGALQAEALRRYEEGTWFRESEPKVAAAQRSRSVQLGGQGAPEGCLDDIVSRGLERWVVQQLENGRSLVPCGQWHRRGPEAVGPAGRRAKFSPTFLIPTHKWGN